MRVPTGPPGVGSAVTFYATTRSPTVPHMQQARQRCHQGNAAVAWHGAPSTWAANN